MAIIIAFVTAVVVAPESTILTILKTSETGSVIFSPTVLVGDATRN